METQPRRIEPGIFLSRDVVQIDGVLTLREPLLDGTGEILHTVLHWSEAHQSWGYWDYKHKNGNPIKYWDSVELPEKITNIRTTEPDFFDGLDNLQKRWAQSHNGELSGEGYEEYVTEGIEELMDRIAKANYGIRYIIDPPKNTDQFK